MNAIYWLQNDLLLHDNHTFWKACEEAEEVVPVYIFNPQEKKTAPFKMSFLQESLSNACTVANKQAVFFGNEQEGGVWI